VQDPGHRLHEQRRVCRQGAEAGVQVLQGREQLLIVATGADDRDRRVQHVEDVAQHRCLQPTGAFQPVLECLDRGVCRFSAGREVVDIPAAFEFCERIRERVVALVVQVSPFAEPLEAPVELGQVDWFRPPARLG
jgi:hypothetical protein